MEVAELSIFQLIRQSCRLVAESAKNVKINLAKLDSYLKNLDLKEPPDLIMDEENHFCGDFEKTVAYFVVLDSINFGSGYFSNLENPEDKTGYFLVASKLKSESIRQNGFSCDYLQKLSLDKCFDIFAQSRKNDAIRPLMQLFTEALHELGAFVEKKYSGSFIEMVEAAEHSAAGLIETLTQMPYYQDFADYHGQKVFFFKRAQITVSDLNIALKGEGPGRFDDLAELTIFADNLVPHVLWLDELLEYSEDLATKIKNRDMIEAGSDYEIELRAAAVHAVELLRATAAKQGLSLTSQQLDYVLWNRGQAEKYRRIEPHSTHSYFY